MKLEEYDLDNLPGHIMKVTFGETILINKLTGKSSKIRLYNHNGVTYTDAEFAKLLENIKVNIDES